MRIVRARRRPAVRFGDLAHDRETESGARHAARGRRAVEAVEDERHVFLRDARAAVTYRELTVADDHVHLAVGRAPLRGVVQQVRNRALDGGRNPAHQRLLELWIEHHARPVADCSLDRVGGHEIEPHVFRLLWMLVAARQLDELGDQRGHLDELLADVAQQLLALVGVECVVAREDLDVRPQARQRRAQLV